MKKELIGTASMGGPGRMKNAKYAQSTHLTEKLTGRRQIFEIPNVSSSPL